MMESQIIFLKLFLSGSFGDQLGELFQIFLQCNTVVLIFIIMHKDQLKNIDLQCFTELIEILRIRIGNEETEK